MYKAHGDPLNRNYKIAAIGSASEELEDYVYQQAREIGRLLGKHEEVESLTCGGTTGVTRKVAEEARRVGLKTVGYSPAMNVEEHKKFGLPVKPYSELVFITDYLKKNKIKELDKRARFKLRIPYLIANSDGLVAISGRVGTTTEILNGIDMRKPIAILKGSGGISDKISGWLDYLGELKDLNVDLVYEKKPKKLVSNLMDLL